MLKNIKYETNDINEVVLDLADEIKNGWKLVSCNRQHVDFTCNCKPDITVEVTLTKRF